MKKRNELKKVKQKNQEVSEFDFLICPNCGEQEVGKYCPNCGQSNKDYNKPVKEIVGDLLDSINLDIRLLNTLVPFFTKPGFLTEEYFNGRRKRYVPPMRMYMFVSIIFFFLVQYFSSDEIKDNIVNVDNTEQTTSKIKIADNSKNENLTIVENDSSEKNNVVTFDNFNSQDIEKFKQEALNDTTVTDLEKEFIIGGLNAAEKKDLFFDKFMKNVSYVLFLLMPFFALILAMILWKSKMLYIKHLIFSINFHAFIFGLSSIIIVLGELLPESVSGYVLYLWLGIPIYLMLGIRRFYQRRYVGSFFKMFGALFLYFFIICIVIVLILVFTAKGFYNI